jgi:hypothetical protein
MKVRRLPSNVQAEKLKDGGASSEHAFQPPDRSHSRRKKVSESMPKRMIFRTAAGDPLVGLVEDRFRLLKQCPAVDDPNDEEVFDCRLDETQRRVRRLDEWIVRTVATSTPGLLAQLRLLAAFYEESANGAGRRGSLLIQAIAEGVVQLQGRTRPGIRC